MNYQGMKRGEKSGVRIFIFVLLSCIILIYLFLNIIKTDGKNKNMQRNMMYVEIINYSMPLVKVTSFDSDDMAESKISVKDNLFKLAGITINEPLNILSREMACFLPLHNSGDDPGTSKYVGIVPFKFNPQNTSVGDVDQQLNLPDKFVELDGESFKKELPSKPEVLIYHTHTTESYSPSTPNNLDSTKNVCAVGEVLKKELEEKYGVSVIHDMTIHNATAYNKSYSRSAVTVDKYLKEYGDFKLVIDMHRDSVEDRSKITTKVNGTNVAKIMFVTTKKNPRYNENIKVVNALNKIAKSLNSDYSRGLLERNYGNNYYNQNKSDSSILIEVGSHKSTLDEAKNSGRVLARIIAEYINSEEN